MRLNTVAAVAFIVGGVLFAVGAGVSQFGQFGRAGTSTMVSALVYFIGGLFFNTGGYTSLLEVINAPRREVTGMPDSTRWKWWSYEPLCVDWLSACTLFAGTLVFGINLLDSFLRGLTVRETNRLIWAPDMVGCVLFLVSGHLALFAIRHGTPGVRGRGLAWWTAAVNQFGSALFMVSALAAFTRPATGSLVNEGVANWGTLTGALCFSVAGTLQLFQDPG